MAWVPLKKQQIVKRVKNIYRELRYILLYIYICCLILIAVILCMVCNIVYVVVH